MTTVNVKITHNKVTSWADGFGVAELEELVKKIPDGCAWRLELYSDAVFSETSANLDTETTLSVVPPFTEKSK